MLVAKLPVGLAMAGIFSLNQPALSEAMPMQTNGARLLSVSEVQTTTNKFYGMVKNPKNEVDIFRNIKLAFDLNLLLREDFYTDDNLKAFFGGQRVVWDYNSPDKQRGEIVDFIFNGLPLKISIRFKRTVKSNGQDEAELYIVFREASSINFEFLVSMFGTEFKIPIAQAYLHGIPVESVVKPHGNEHIVYEFDELDTHRMIDIKLQHDASLYHATFFEMKNDHNY
jgi:hypothetical protein